MAAHMPVLDEIMAQVQQLSATDQLRLIKWVAEMLVLPERRAEPIILPYGKYTEGRESTEEDFLLAEWHPSERDLDEP